MVDHRIEEELLFRLGSVQRWAAIEVPCWPLVSCRFAFLLSRRVVSLPGYDLLHGHVITSFTWQV